jgi:hypothetical protein
MSGVPVEARLIRVAALHVCAVVKQPGCSTRDCVLSCTPEWRAQVAAERTTRARRGAELARARARGPLPARLLREGALRAGYALADHTRNALILSVFAFKARRARHPCDCQGVLVT